MIEDRTLTNRGRADGRWCARAFTLIELLVVIALLGILFSMTGPALVKVLNKARELQYLNNVRNISIAHSLYSSDHNDRIVPHAAFRNPPSGALVPNTQMTFWPGVNAAFDKLKAKFDKMDLPGQEVLHK